MGCEGRDVNRLTFDVRGGPLAGRPLDGGVRPRLWNVIWRVDDRIKNAFHQVQGLLLGQYVNRPLPLALYREPHGRLHPIVRLP